MNMSMKLKDDCEISKGIFGLEITTTNSCNFKCNYCFEKDTILSSLKPVDSNILIEKIYEFMNSDFFKNTYSGLKIIFWGGEPTLALDTIIALVEEFEDNDRVAFFLYTNGSRIPEIIDMLKRVQEKPFIKKDIPKFNVQVSYDGYPVHDAHRRTKNNESTTPIVMDAVELLSKNNLKFGLKSTLSWDYYRHIVIIWDDFKFLHELYGDNISYNLTVDYYDINLPKRRFDMIIKPCLFEIAAREFNFFKENRRFLSNIFRRGRALCATGKNMATINTKGEIYYCHGSLYTKESQDFKYSSIFDKNFINSIEESHNFFDSTYEPEECKECLSTMCLRCNVQKYVHSDKETFFDRWYDYPVQKELCDYYKLVGKIGIALRTKVKRYLEEKDALRM